MGHAVGRGGEVHERGVVGVAAQPLGDPFGVRDDLAGPLPRSEGDGLGVDQAGRTRPSRREDQVRLSLGESPCRVSVGKKFDKLGYHAIDSAELVFDDYRLSKEHLIGGVEGQGFFQATGGLELGRINVAARGVGLAEGSLRLATEYAQVRETMGKPIAQHQAIQFKLAEMATKVEAAHAMMVNAARLKDAGKRNDVESGMAKLIGSEFCNEVVQESFRIHGGYGYSKEYEIERLMREAPFMLIGEGTSEIQKTIISRGLLKDYALRG